VEKKFTLKVTIPPNTSATVIVPATSTAAVTGKENGFLREVFSPFSRQDDSAVFIVESGNYVFTAQE
jgi:hypothetical protein